MKIHIPFKQEVGPRSLSAEQLKEKLEQYKGRRAQYEQLKSDLERSGERQVTLTDPQSRSYVRGTVGYNVRMVVDHKHKLVLEYEVTNEVTDQGQLSAMAGTAKEMLGVETLEVVADRGYYNGEEVKACEQSGMRVYVPNPNNSSNLKRGLFTKEDFVYDPQKDCYQCPTRKDELSLRQCGTGSAGALR